MCVQNAITPIVFRFAMTEASSKNRFSTVEALMWTEALKLVLSIGLIVVEEGGNLPRASTVLNDEVIKKPRDTLALAIPAILYAIQNCCLQWSTSNLPAALFQVTYQGKILVTTMFSVILLHKKLLRAQWLAIALLTMGIAVVQLANASETKQSKMANAKEQSISAGLFFVLTACLCSGFASVYFEKIVKQGGVAKPASSQKKASVWVQNAQLAGFTIMITACGVLSERLTSSTSDTSIPEALQTPRTAQRTFFFNGFTTNVWIMMVNNAFGGLIVALVIKYADNILRGFATACATILAAVGAVLCFGFELQPLFGLGTMVVLGSVMIYGNVLQLPGEFWNSEFEVCAAIRRSAGDDKDAASPAAKGATSIESSPIGNSLKETEMSMKNGQREPDSPKE